MGSLVATDFDVFNGFYNTINGQSTKTETTRHGINPATGKPNPDVPVATPEDVDHAVAAAKEAFKTWSKTPWEERKKAVLKFADALEAHTDNFAKLLTQEQGKPVGLLETSAGRRLNNSVKYRFDLLFKRSKWVFTGSGNLPKSS